MKTLNETFTDQEFEALLKVKGKRTWRGFLLMIACSKGLVVDVQKGESVIMLWEEVRNKDKVKGE